MSRVSNFAANVRQKRSPKKQSSDMMNRRKAFALIFEVLDILPIVSYPIPSMYYGIFSYMYHKNRPNVGKYTIYIYIWMVCVL